MRKVEWTLEKLRGGFDKFKLEHGHYPTSHEIDNYPHLPSSRQIQRRFVGGLPALRKQLKLDGPEDFTKGEYSSDRARMIGRRARGLEKTIYDFLVKQFGLPFVHREYFFVDDKRTRTDFFIYTKNGNFSIDVFYPKDHKNLINCLNSKMRTYSQSMMLEYPVIFLMMNDTISKEEIQTMLTHKKKKLHSHQRVMTFGELQDFCEKKISLSV